MRCFTVQRRDFDRTNHQAPPTTQEPSAPSAAEKVTASVTMPATVEALLIILVIVMPGFITVRTKEMLVPSVGKPDALQITLRSITASLLYLPLWLVFAGNLLLLRRDLLQLSEVHRHSSIERRSLRPLSSDRPRRS